LGKIVRIQGRELTVYTKCPECQIAFRVSAKILQMAGGNVRCGNCDHPFSALAYLTEDLPDDPAPEGSSSTGDESSDKLAETSKRLLETLDELAGPEEVRIEDTGIEWRVLDSHASESADSGDELRYDDNTPLPEDFDDEDESVYTPPPTGWRSEDHARISEQLNERQQDLALSDPEDWTELLDEVMDPEVDALEVEEELAAIHTELSGVAATLEVDGDKPPALDLEVGAVDEELALDLEVSASGEAKVLDLELGESGESRELDLEVEASDEPAELDLEIDEPAADTGVDLDIEEPGEEAGTDLDIDEPGVEADPNLDIEEPVSEADPDLDIEEDEPDVAAGSEDDEATEADRDTGVEETAEERETAGSATADDDGDDEAIAAADEEPAEPVLTVLADGSTTDENTPEKENPALYVPEPTEEEMTVNMEIDQELLAAAAEDKEFTATLVGIENPEEIFEQNPDEVETIIMEGEFIRSAMDKERLAAENAAQERMTDGIDPADTYALSRKRVGRPWWRIRPPSAGMTAGAILLLLALGVQFVHYSRESLATMGFFNQTIAPVYRMIGMPVTPEWDIKGWQFEATNGSVNEEDSVLTIVSRLGNRSAHPLPYPLLHVSLTDRWEDIMGSRVLEPSDYLSDQPDPSRPVLPGENFTAVIAIQDPSIEATGFKLNVCYRVAPGTVRCAIEDFKH
jgi:predicted Zn finger-like uncharacterized protein